VTQKLPRSYLTRSHTPAVIPRCTRAIGVWSSEETCGSLLRGSAVSCGALLASFPANSDWGTETLEDIAAGIRERFPRLEISAFTCAGVTCSKTINFFTFSAVIVVTMGANDRPVAIAAVMSAPKDRELFDTAFSACADAIVSITAPDMPLDQRSDFANRVMDAHEAGIRYGDWTFTSSTAPYSRSRIFQANR